MLHGLLAAGGGGNIGKNVGGFDAVFGGEVGAVFLCAGFIVREAVETDVCAFGGELVGDDCAEAGGAAGDEGVAP